MVFLMPVWQTHLKKKTLIFSVFLLSFLERQVDHHPTVFKPGFHDVLQADLTLNLSSS